MYTTPNSIRFEPIEHAKTIALESVRLNLEIVTCNQQ